VRAVELGDAGLVLNRNVMVKIHGGYDSGFVQDQGETVLKGRVYIRSGSVRVRSLVLRPA
jgi:hypothetical protein